ncbi:uncharacterized protein LOC124613686 [Schistocerca americana]|uniref:uncharacterized protein LOC124613686 n=1 Tax=Schistocerca americana TaxID=7009 RepID=UPI001F4F2DFA|nr:uncharacterized protein LOC124613686 [Schistocerca americana]
MFECLVAETNQYAKQKIDSQQLSQFQANEKERNTYSRDEMFLWHYNVDGFVKMPNLARYWSKSMVYSNKVSSIMSHNQFEILLRLFHPSNNDTRLEGGRLHKVQHLLDLIVPKFKDTICPQEEICINETIIPFRRHLSLRQYVPDKRHRHGVKVFWLYTEPQSLCW